MPMGHASGLTSFQACTAPLQLDGETSEPLAWILRAAEGSQDKKNPTSSLGHWLRKKLTAHTRGPLEIP